jgi:hypothetical protein
MSGESGPGEVYNRRVTKHLRSLLPDRTRGTDDFTFGGQTVLDTESNPGKPAGGTCRIKAYVGVDGQITVLERSEVCSGEDVLWASRNLIRRTHEVGGAEMEPFRYHVQTKIRSRETTKDNQAELDVDEFTSKPVYGGREAQAALLLAERVASETESGGATGSSCCSLADLPSFPRVVGRGWLGLDWQTINNLLGPDADTIAANVSIGSVRDDEREAAEAKGIEIFTPGDPDVNEAVGDRSPTNAGRPDPHVDDEEVSTELPDDVSPSEAERRIFEMIERIRTMKSDE